MNNTMAQESRQELWCSACENECSDVCDQCVFAGVSTKYKTQKPKFEHRQKTIGKSKYAIVKVNGGYTVKEIYNVSKVAESKYTHRNINDALSELEAISYEQYYTDSSKTINY